MNKQAKAQFASRSTPFFSLNNNLLLKDFSNLYIIVVFSNLFVTFLLFNMTTDRVAFLLMLILLVSKLAVVVGDDVFVLALHKVYFYIFKF
jgi:hypothetical protein